MKVTFVYILKCSDDTYFTGITIDISRRLLEHQKGKFKKCYTFKRRPLQLVYYIEFPDDEFAIATYRQIKNWSQAKKEALINAEYEKLPNLARKDFGERFE